MYLITGSAGFIGFHLSKSLIERNKEVLGIDNFSNYYDPKLKKKRNKILKKNKNYKFINFDLSKKKNFYKLNKYKDKIKIIIHLAGQAGVRYSIKNPQSYILNNPYAYINILEFFKDSKSLELISYASSSSVFGDKVQNSKINIPVSVYAASKQSMESISNVYSYLYKIKIIGMRFFTVYGPWGRPDMSIYKFSKKIINQKQIEIYNYGNHERSFTYIDDIVQNVLKMIKVERKENIKFNNTISIGNPRSIKLMEIVKILEKYFNKKTIKTYLPLQPGDVKKTKANIKKETSKYGFVFKTQIKDGIKKFIKWFNEKK